MNANPDSLAPADRSVASGVYWVVRALYPPESDNQPLTFGKYKGYTPNQLLEEEHLSYITWMYENVKTPTCSSQLYEEAKQQLELEEYALIEEIGCYYDAENYGDR